MKVLQPKKTHACAAIEQAMAKPMQKADIPAVPLDSRMQGATLAAEVIATMKTHAKHWHTFAWNIIRMPADGRIAFQNAVKKELDALKAENETVHGASKELARTLRSATVQVSRLNTIAKAWNAGAHETGLAEFCGCSDPENVGFIKVYEYAQQFVKADAGRPAQSIKVKLQNFIKGLAKGEDGIGETDLLNLRRAQEWVESLKD